MKLSRIRWLQFFILMGILTYAVIPVIAQEEASIEHDTVKARQYFEQGKLFAENLQLDSAILLLEESIALNDEAQNWLVLVDAYNYLCRVLFEKGNYEEAKTKLKRNLHLSFQDHKSDSLIGRTYQLLGDIYIDLGDLDSAEFYLNEALNKRVEYFGANSSEVDNIYYSFCRLYFYKDDYKTVEKYAKLVMSGTNNLNGKNVRKAEALNVIGIIFYSKADYFNAREYFQLGLNEFGENESLKAQNLYNSILENLGAVEFLSGNYELANQYYLRVLDWRLLHLRENNISTARSYLNIAEVYDQRCEYNKAIELIQKSIEIRVQLLGEYNIRVLRALNYLATVYLNKGDVNSAFITLKRALDIDANFRQEHVESANVYQQLGLVFQQLEEFDSALHYYNLSLRVLEGKYGNEHPKVAKCLLKKADLFRKMGSLELSLLEHRKALNSVSKPASNSLTIDDIRFATESIDVLRSSAISLRHAFISGIRDIEGLEKASTQIHLATELILKKRILIFDKKAQRDFSERYAPVYDQGLTIALLLYRESTNSELLEEAFSMMERSKAFTLNQSIQDRDEPIVYALPDSLIERERSLKVDISFYEEEILNRRGNLQGYDTALVRKYEDKLFYRKRDFEHLKQQLEQEFPRYHQLKYENQSLQLAEVQNRLRNDELLIEYLWQGDLVTMVAVSSGNVDFKEIVVDSLLINDFERLRSAFHDPGYTISIKEYAAHSQHVFQTLLAPALEVAEMKPKKLIIIPDGPLAQVNFDLLLTESVAADSDWQELPYLIKDYSIATGYSASLFFDESNGRKKSKADLLAFSFNEENHKTGDHLTMDVVRSSDLSALPGSSKEIKTIADMVDGDYFYGNSASEQTFKAVAEDYQILHLALHGSVDEENPDYSKLHFHTQDTTEDGLLHVFELYNMELNADLAVLSACNTGSGKYQAGEGIMSLGHAFSYAGVNSLLLTRWDLADEAAPEIMRVFYRELKQGKSKSEAIRTAKLAYLENASMFRSNPFYWGSFFVLGDDSPVEFNTSKVKYYWMAGLMLLLSLAIFIRYRQRQILDKQSGVSS